MHKRRINAVSSQDAALLQRLAESRDVPIYQVPDQRQAGRCRSFEVHGEDLWADVELEDWVLPRPGVHAEAFIAGGEIRALLLTTLPRGMLGAAVAGHGFAGAFEAARRYAANRDRRLS